MYTNNGTGAYTSVDRAASSRPTTRRRSTPTPATSTTTATTTSSSPTTSTSRVVPEEQHDGERHRPRRRCCRLEQAPNRAAGAAPTVVRVQVVRQRVVLHDLVQPRRRSRYTVNGGPAQFTRHDDARMGQIFRGEIPGNLVGTIAYRAIVDRRVRQHRQHGDQELHRDDGASPAPRSAIGLQQRDALPVRQPVGPRRAAATTRAAHRRCFDRRLPAGASLATDDVDRHAAGQ